MGYGKRLVVAMLLGLVSVPAQADFRVFACEPEWSALVRALMPDAHLTTATTHLQDPHYIEARPSLIANMRRADLAVCTGASLEAGWLPTLLQRAANPKVQNGRPGLFFAADHAHLHAPHEHVDRSMGDVHPEGNPHVHLAPDQLPHVAKALADRLEQLRPDAAEAIGARYRSWRDQWRQHRARWQESASRLKGHSVVVQHTTFHYLLQWLGVEATIDLEPKPGLPPSASYLGELLAMPGLDNTRAILIATHQDPQPAEWLSERTGTPVLVLPGTVTNDSQTASLAGLITTIVHRRETTVAEGSDGGL